MPHRICSPESADISKLLSQLQQVQTEVFEETERVLSHYDLLHTPYEARLSLRNMWHYVLLRRLSVHQLQSSLARAGLSSLGRIEPHVMTNLLAVLDVLTKANADSTSFKESSLASEHEKAPEFPDYNQGYEWLAERSQSLFGPIPSGRSEYIMVTLPSDAAEDPSLVDSLFEAGMNCARINCAHDAPALWKKMLERVRKTSLITQTACPVMMDLAGHKIRTHRIWCAKSRREKPATEPKGPRVFLHDYLILSRNEPDKKLATSMFSTPVEVMFDSTYPDLIDRVKPGQSLWIDDGKIGTRIETVGAKGLLLQVTHVGPKGARLKPEKGLNLPQTDLKLPTLSDKDMADLDFVSEHADLVALSFTETPDDIRHLHALLTQRGRADLPIIAKIETPKGVLNLPEILAAALVDNMPFGVMMARGDLAVELGSVQMAETQDAFLRLCEAAHMPVIWATQVLESLAKNGVVSRPEISDAAMSQRAECVMLNKGPYIADAVRILSEVLQRMEHSQFKSHTHLPTLPW